MNRRLFDFLIVNVVFNHSFRFIAYASNKVGKTPEIRLPIILSQLRTEGFPDLPWWSRFKCVNKLRKIELRICVKQYMHMIRHCFNRLHTKFMIFKVSARIIFQKILEFSRYCRFSVFCNQYKMILQQKSTVLIIVVFFMLFFVHASASTWCITDIF